MLRERVNEDEGMHVPLCSVVAPYDEQQSTEIARKLAAERLAEEGKLPHY